MEMLADLPVMAIPIPTIAKIPEPIVCPIPMDSSSFLPKTLFSSLVEATSDIYSLLFYKLILHIDITAHR